ncbi:MAG: FumA C-terminus/TtdB family hydratase beta subunit [Candidatus Cloacimonas sp.]|nr:FumA C-terminus/TtdB family hydratase beta subunit [Candidatus Cloacimonas sp.]
MNTHGLTIPLSSSAFAKLSVGDKVLLSGSLFTARDEAHKKLVQYLKEGRDIGFSLNDSVLFYCGPSPIPAGKICGAVGPTTSARMDKWTPILLDHGLRVMLGKGERSTEVVTAIHEHKALYLTSIGGISALLSRCIVSCETFLWPELGPEAIFKLTVKDFPAYVAIV